MKVNLYEVLLRDAFDYFDETIYHFLSMYISENLTKFMTVITHMGSSYTLILITIITYGIFSRFRTYAPYRSVVVLNLAITWILNEVLKELFQRERPDILQLVQVHGYSFPSGHAMISFTFYGLLIFIFFKHSHNKRIRFLISTVLGILVFSIGLSRIYLGVHYASDVLAGFILGFMWLAMLIRWVKMDQIKKIAYFVK